MKNVVTIPIAFYFFAHILTIKGATYATCSLFDDRAHTFAFSDFNLADKADDMSERGHDNSEEDLITWQSFT
jgi:hypothetical protein